MTIRDMSLVLSLITITNLKGNYYRICGDDNEEEELDICNIYNYNLSLNKCQLYVKLKEKTLLIYFNVTYETLCISQHV